MSHPAKPSDWWNEGVADVCTNFQVDLSCLVDGELDEAAAGRVMLHLEECDGCRDFFEDTRDCLRLHLDVADPDRLLARLSTLTGSDLAHEAQGIELVHRLATIFYQLGKAYLLTAIDSNFRTRVFERALPVETTQTEGRGFVDGVLLKGAPKGAMGPARVDWQEARSMLNGRLKQIQSPLEKARKLLQEAIDADPSHEEALLYMAYLHASEGKALKAADGYRRVFETALSESNRGHAAVQLGLLHCQEQELRKAVMYFRWVSLSGLDRRDERFFFVRFNSGVNYALLSASERGHAAAIDRERALDAFRGLLDRHSGRLAEIAQLFASSKRLQQAIGDQSGFVEALLQRCPELFRPAQAEDASRESFAPLRRRGGRRSGGSRLMRTLWNGLEACTRLRAVRASLLAVALGAVLTLGSNVATGDGGMTAGGGGDQIGSLPCNQLPPEHLVSTPSFILEGSLHDLLESVVAADGSGSASLIQDLETGNWRLGFHGMVRVWFNRNYIESGRIATSMTAGSVFSGGIAVIKLNGTTQGRVLLPVVGALPVPLAELSSAGVLNHSNLTVNSISPSQKHHVLAMSASAHLVRIELRN